MKKIIVIAVLIFALAGAIVFVARTIPQEDNWLCINGDWVKHGQSSAPMPATGCGEQGKAPLKSDKTDQPFITFSETGFSVDIPDWPNVEKEKLLDPVHTKLAIANDGCNIAITFTELPANITYKNYMESRVAEQLKNFPASLSAREVGDNTARLEADLTMNGIALHSVSYGFATVENGAYGVVFIAEKGRFGQNCLPFIEKVIASVKAE